MPTQNNGKLASQTDNVSGEQVVYAYDALNRLASATATSGSWGQSYSYDGFGNLTAQNVTAGSAPAYSAIPDPTTNHVGSVDANGNTLGLVDPDQETQITSAEYDVENRFVGTGATFSYYSGYQYSYAPGNKRVWRGNFGTNSGGAPTITTDEVTFWSVTGQKVASYNIVMGSSITFNIGVANYYFGGKLVGHFAGGGYVGLSNDRLGSVGKYYPYGQEKPSATPNGTEKFTGYFRDSETGFDYANNRYHNPGTGRFLTSDPYQNSAGPTDPGSWNRYAYTRGDPVNRYDPTGLEDSDDPDDGDCNDSGEYCAGGGAGGGDGGGGSGGDDSGSVGSLLPGMQGGTPLGVDPDPTGTGQGSGSPFIGTGGAIGAGGVILEGVCVFVEPCGPIEVIGTIVIGVGAIIVDAPSPGPIFRGHKPHSQAGQAAELNWALAKYRQQCPGHKPLTPAQLDALHRAITGQDLTKQEILEQIIAMFGCGDSGGPQ